MQGVAGEDVGGQRVDQWFQQRRRGSDPAGQGRSLQVHPVARKDLGLAVERQVVVIFRDDDMSEQPRPGTTAGDCVIGGRRGDHRVTGPAG